jgi:predicted RecB family nuclease
MISNEVFVSHLFCRRKAFFKHAGQSGETAEIERVQVQLDKTYTRSALDWFLARHGAGEVLRDPPALETALHSRAPFIVGATARAGNLCSRLDLLERQEESGEAASYAPVLFVRNTRVTKNDRLLLAFQALALSLVQGVVPTVGKIVCGSEPRVVRVRLPDLVEEVRRLVALMEADAAQKTAPTLTLNRHCAACEFRKGCQAQAEQTDDLSLLRCLPEKEIHKLRARGVTTLLLCTTRGSYNMKARKEMEKGP